MTRPDANPRRPSLWARFLLAFFCPGHLREEVAGDLEELYARRAARSGARHARRMYLRDLRSLARLAATGEGNRADQFDALIAESTRGGRFMNAFLQDVRYGLRMLAKNPGFTLVAALTLALGIGANTAIFSVVNALYLRPFPVENPDELVSVFVRGERSPFGTFSYPDYADYRDGSTTLSGLVAYGSFAGALVADDQSRVEDGEIVSGNYFDALGVRLTRGRGFLPEEDATPRSHPVAVISDALWRGRFHADPQITGRKVTLQGEVFTIIGVAPPRFNGVVPGRAPNIWVPMMMQSLVRPPSAALRRSMGGSYDLLGRRGPSWLRVVGRVKPGVSTQQAQADLELIAARLAKEYEATNTGRGALVTRMNEGPGLRREAQPIVLLLSAATGVLLLIACANLANMLLARATARNREIAIRLSLGAGRSRLVRQLLIESVLLALPGGVFALLIGVWSSNMWYAIGLPAGIGLGVDWRVMIFTLALALATGVLFGLLPALNATRASVLPALKDNAGAAGGGTRRARARNLILVTQVALSLVLLIGAGLFQRSLRIALVAEMGFRPEGVLAATLNFDLLSYDEARGFAFYRRVLERLNTHPGVQSASISRVVPLSGSSRIWNIRPLDGPFAQTAEPLETFVNTISPGYFQTLRIPLRRGREFTELDARTAPPVAILSEALARRLWPNEDPLGKRLASFAGPNGPPVEVVGVAANTKYASVREEESGLLFLPIYQNYEGVVNLQVRAKGDPRSLVESLRAEIAALDSNLPLYQVATLPEVIRQGVSGLRIPALVLGLFGPLALLLAAVGIYGVMSYSVALQIKEIGVRMALGASRGGILRMIVGSGLRLASMGIAIGIAGALAATHWLAGMLFGLSPMDPVTYFAVTAMLLLVASVACWVPAWRASRTDPMVALRYE